MILLNVNIEAYDLVHGHILDTVIPLCFDSDFVDLTSDDFYKSLISELENKFKNFFHVLAKIEVISVKYIRV